MFWKVLKESRAVKLAVFMWVLLLLYFPISLFTGKEWVANEAYQMMYVVGVVFLTVNIWFKYTMHRRENP